MADGYEVDLDALDQVVKELNQVLKDMAAPKDKAKYGTYVPSGALGNGFSEAQDLYEAHGKMKQRIEEDMIDKIEKLVDKFGRKTDKARGVYQDAEAENTMSDTDVADRNA
ncbi:MULTISPECIES: hypothetical protein [unclassified Streptomyces]|uniref:hypothetical protein n=1 Tax=unclassified Streptomyces TaxID=2593676 RepID=UPI000DBA4E79|nr:MULTISPECIES: hypothetical protein [unclassified Streptomyces]MYT73288.1 hypothetical protein [Streptomyces sp. SID8367]RAJ74888.1 hypothetical protein K377_06655 [Streptomyces sp. PsTaAH-137]